ncbi:serine/threonine-protein kinase [Streptomyces sp. NPDC059142]|uniref:serine/threonine-protein kinase n=1 Tax=Streptomyces sp. NPDC059142 TaxID=3346739 RepID=UPI0036CF4DA1
MSAGEGGPPDGRLIAGRYRLGSRLGRGGMGTVWRAEDELLGRYVAVKELHAPHDGHDGHGGPHGEGGPHGQDGRSATTLREARAVARVKHPHVVVVHDVVQEDGRPYIVMELVEGGSLADRLRASTLDPREAARVALALLSALRAAHGLGVLHRDLKPANVLLEEPTGRVVLTDFGIARLVGATTITDPGAFVGSPEYSAPERVLNAEAAGPASDLWSLGALVCAMLSGESPFRRDSLPGVLHAVVADEIRPPAAAEPLLPLVRGLLERDPEHRLDAAEAERLLTRYVATGAPLQEPPLPAPSPPGPPPPGPPAPGPVRAPAVAPAPVPARAAAPPADGTEDAPTADRPLPAALPAPAPSTTPSPGPAPLPGRTRIRIRTRTTLVVGALACVLAGAGAVTALLLRDGSDSGRTTGNLTTASAAPVHRTGNPHAPSPSPSPPSPPSPSATAPPAAAPPAAPDGYRSVRDPMGFTLAVPDGYARSHDDKRVYYMSQDKALRIGIRVQDRIPGGPVASMRQADERGVHTNPGYHDGSVTPTSHNGFRAALWEFTWEGFTPAEGERHTFDLCWEEAGRMYDVWVSAPLDKLDTARGQFDAALDSFVPAATAAASAPVPLR